MLIHLIWFQKGNGKIRNPLFIKGKEKDNDDMSKLETPLTLPLLGALHHQTQQKARAQQTLHGIEQARVCTAI